MNTHKKKGEVKGGASAFLVEIMYYRIRPSFPGAEFSRIALSQLFAETIFTDQERINRFELCYGRAVVFIIIMLISSAIYIAIHFVLKFEAGGNIVFCITHSYMYMHICMHVAMCNARFTSH